MQLRNHQVHNFDPPCARLCATDFSRVNFGTAHHIWRIKSFVSRAAVLFQSVLSAGCVVDIRFWLYPYETMLPTGVFSTGGTVQASGGIYIRRPAGDELFHLCVEGRY